MANKDLAGGFGTATRIGSGVRARLIELAKKRGVRLPILSMAYVAAIFEKKGWTVKVVDSAIGGESVADIAKISRDFSPSLCLVVSSIFGFDGEIETAKAIKAASPGCKAGAFGPMATYEPKLFLGGFDFVIRGEPELVALEIASGKELEKVSGTMHLAGGKIADNGVAGYVEDLDSLPYPAWHLFPIEKYGYSPVITAKPFLTVLSSKGCPFACNYCPYVAGMGEKWRSRSVESVVREIEFLCNKFKVRGIQFRDPLFTFNQPRIKELCRKLKERKLGVLWGCETRLDFLDEALIDEMHSAGCRAINVGVESASDEILARATRKSIAKAHMKKIISYAESKGISICAFYIIGLLEDSNESIRNTIELAKELGTSIAQFSIATPYPGTKFYEILKGQGVIDEKIPFHEYDGYTAVMKHPRLSREELEKWREIAFCEYYFQPKLILRHAKLDYFLKLLGK